MLDIRNCSVKLDGDVRLDFKVAADELVESLSLEEAQEVVLAIYNNQGVLAFKGISDEVVDEFHTCPEAE